MDYEKRSFMQGRETDPIRRNNRPKPFGRVILSSFDEDDTEESSDIATSSSQTSINSHAGNSTIPSESANVYLRIRPLESDAVVWKFRIEADTFIAANLENAQTKNKNTIEQHYKFSHVFDDYTPQMEIYNMCVKPLISVEDSATIMVYGTSGSGKTHTLLGETYNPGLVPRALAQLFIEYGNNISTYPVCKLQNGIPVFNADDQIYQEERIKTELMHTMAESHFHKEMLAKLKTENVFEAKFIENCHLFLWVSFVEIYNEEVYDLLTPPTTDENKENNPRRSISKKRKNLKVMSNNGHPFVQGAVEIFVRTFEETIKILEYGMNRVSTGSTLINERSSRSHCIFFVDVINWNNISITSRTYKFCDLAGSERLKKTVNIGKRLKEAKNINKSLMTLGRCLMMANERQKNKSIQIPYRDSKLTTLLQNALLGHEKISLIVNLNPKLDYIEENLNVLSFASIAKEIKTKPSERTKSKARISRFSLFISSMSQSRSTSTINEYQQLIDELSDKNFEQENEIAQLKNKLIEQETILRKSIVEGLEEDYQRTVQQYERQIATRKANHKSEIDHLGILLKQKDKLLRKKDNEIEKLKTQNRQLKGLTSNDYICLDDSETDSDESSTSDEDEDRD